MKDKARESFDLIDRMVRTAKASWAIWFELYCNFEHGGPYRIPTQIHFSFWDAIYHSQFHYVFLILNDLFGKRKGTHSFKYLLGICRRRLLPRNAEKCEQLLASVAQYQRGVGIVRGKHVGHKLVDVAVPDVLKQAGLKIKDVDKMLDVADHLVGNLACAFLADPPDLDFESDRDAKNVTIEVLQAQLDKFNALGGKQTDVTQ